jgi:putative hemolysin
VTSLLVESALILVLIIANGVFSGSEIAIVSARKLRLEQLAIRGDRRAATALRLASSPNDFLSTVQIGITLIGILSGAVGGATVAQRLRPLLAAVPALAPWSELLSVVIVVSAITYLSLVIGELVPKRIALNDPEAIACQMAPPMRLLARWASPLVHLLGVSTDALLGLLGVKASGEPDITEEEIKAMIRQGAESGVFEEAEHAIVQRVLRLGDRTTRTLMTPRTEICWLDLEAPLEENVHLVMASPHSRFPVARGALDDCQGVVQGRRLLAARLSGDTVDLESLIQAPLYVTESTRVLNVIERFKRTGVHIALVTDEFGGIEGLVTLNDVMEGIVGDLPSQEDKEDPPIILRDDGSWLLDGALEVGDFKELVGCGALPGEASAGYHTLGGLVLHVLERVPHAGEHFDWNGLRFEVVDMDGKRIDKVLVTRLEEQQADIGNAGMGRDD